MSDLDRAETDLTVIIPFRDHGAMTATALRSLVRLPGASHVIAVDNGSRLEETSSVHDALELLRRSGHQTRLVRNDSPFNFQRINNDAARLCSTRFTLFMNNDARLVRESTRLITMMLALAAEPDLGAIGATLLLGDGRSFQHTGVRLDSGGFASHYLFGRASDEWSTLPNAVVSAVTGAFVMVEARKFWEVEGFDERFIVCGGDVDLCLRLSRHGYRTVVCRDGWAIHDESATRDPSNIPSSDFVESYYSYSTGFDPNTGDQYCNDELPYGLPLWMAG